MQINKNHQNFVLEPSFELIENWKLQTAKEVMMQLRSRANLEINLSQVDSLVNLAEIMAFDHLWENFDDHLLWVKQNADFPDFNKLKSRLDREFDLQVIDLLPQIAFEIEQKYVLALKHYIAKDLQQLSPDRVVGLLKNVTKFLLMQRRDLENSKFLIEKKISSALQSYRILAGESRELYLESIFKALNLHFKSKYELKRNAAFSSLSLQLIEISQKYYNNASKSSIFLKTVEDCLRQKSSIVLCGFPAVVRLGSIDIDKQQSLIDSWLDKTISFWHNAVSIEEFEQKILSQVDSLTKELFYEFQTQFLENTIIKSNLEN